MRVLHGAEPVDEDDIDELEAEDDPVLDDFLWELELPQC